MNERSAQQTTEEDDPIALGLFMHILETHTPFGPWLNLLENWLQEPGILHGFADFAQIPLDALTDPDLFSSLTPQMQLLAGTPMWATAQPILTEKLAQKKASVASGYRFMTRGARAENRAWA
jgi:hypothetical protein